LPSAKEDWYTICSETQRRFFGCENYLTCKYTQFTLKPKRRCSNESNMSSQSQPNSNRLTALDGLRGISSLLVLATHLKLDIPLLTDQIAFLPLRFIVRTIMNTGNISVGFFFILCGFLMAYLYEDPRSYVSFVQKRYLRIFTV
jgi:uncharacterized membrane protein